MAQRQQLRYLLFLKSGRNPEGLPAEAELGYILSIVIHKAMKPQRQAFPKFSDPPLASPQSLGKFRRHGDLQWSVHSNYPKKITPLMIIFCMGVFLFNGFSQNDREE